MYKRGLWAPFIAVLMVMALISGCVQSSAPSSSTQASSAQSQQTTSATQANAAPPENLKDWEIDKTPITLKFYHNYVENPVATLIPGMGKNPVSLKVIEDTGVTLDVTYAPDDTDQRLSLMIATNDLPDFIGFSAAKVDQVREMIQKEMIIDCEEYSKTAAPDLMNRILPSAVVNTKIAIGLNGLYVLPTNVAKPEIVEKHNLPLSMVGFSIASEAYDKVGRPAVKTFDDLYNLLSAINKEYPDMIIHTQRSGSGNKSVIGIPQIVTRLAPYAGINDGANGNGYWLKDGKVMTMLDDPDLLELIKAVNKLYYNKLIFQDEFVVNAPKTANLNAGKVVVEFQEDADNISLFSSKLAEGEWGKKYGLTKYEFIDISLIPGREPVFPKRNFNGQGAQNSFAVVNNANSARTLRFLEYLLYDDDTQRMAVFGIEGRHYDMVDGMPVIRKEFAEAYLADTVKPRNEEGIHYFANSFKNLEWQPLFYAQVFGESEAQREALKITNKYAVDQTMFDGIALFPKDSEAAALLPEISEYVLGEITQMVVGHPDEVEAKFNAMMKALNDYGIDKVNAAINENYNIRQQKVAEYSK